jgi:tetratricopeptide (TPR) repeat protein
MGILNKIIKLKFIAVSMLTLAFLASPSFAQDRISYGAQLLEKGEQELDINALLAAEDIFLDYCVGPTRNSLCEYYLARLYLAEYAYWSQVKKDKKRSEEALEKAEEKGLEAISRRPTDPDSHVVLGKIYQIKLSKSPLSELTKAFLDESPVVKEYRQALRLDAKNGEAEIGLGIYYLFIPRALGGDGHRARGHFKRAAKLMPKDPEPLVWISIAYREDNRLEDARKHLDKAIKLRPASAFVQAENKRLKDAEKAAAGK